MLSMNGFAIHLSIGSTVGASLLIKSAIVICCIIRMEFHPHK